VFIGAGIQFAPNTMTANFRVDISDDGITETNETFFITIDQSGLSNGVVIGDPGQITVTIIDNDGKYIGHLSCPLITF